MKYLSNQVKANKYVWLLFLLPMSLLVNGQIDTEIDLNKVVPENPNVASLMKAALTPVTEYAGLPNVQIPIYNVDQKSIRVPVSISYHTGGIKVGEESGSVGLGWALNAGGVINRTINGYPDFDEYQDANPYFESTEPTPDPVITTNPINGASYFDLSQNAFIRATDSCEFDVNGVPYDFGYNILPEGDIPDSLPDLYTFNFNGYSGSFVMEKDGSIYMLDKNSNYIQWEQTGTYDYTFAITTEDGTKHYFEHFGKTQPDYPLTKYHISTWYLTKSVSTTHDVVLYEYEVNTSSGLNETQSYPIKSFVQEMYYNQGQGGPTGLVNIAGPQVAIDDIYLTKISYGRGEVINGEVVLGNTVTGQLKFNYSDTGGTPRQDIPTAFYLRNIQVLDFNSNLVEQHDFYYSYFGDPAATPGMRETGDYISELNGYNASTNPHLNLRLRLDSIASNGKTHEFDYHDANIIPNKTSMSQDYWGFYNGIQNNGSFIGFGTPNFSALGNQWKAERYPVESKAKLFSLKRITYPTKGYTVFDFESNTYNTLYTSIPTQTDSPPATVPKSDILQTFGGAQVTSKVIEPKGENTVIKMNLAIYSTTVTDFSNHPFDFASDMYVKYTDNTSGESYTRYFYLSDAISQFEASGTVYQTAEVNIGTAPLSGYTFEVYFNDYGGMYSGMASAVVEWDELEVGDSNDGDPGKFALGGGLRIKSITDYDFTNQPVRKRTFDYHYKDTIAGNPVERSYGLIKEVPKNHLGSALHPIVKSTNQVAGASLVARTYSNNGYSKDFGSYVGYDQVTVTFENRYGEDNGKTVSQFFNYQDFEVTDNIGIPFFPSMYQFPQIRLPHNGIMYHQANYKRNNDNTYTMISRNDMDYMINKDVDAENFDYQEMFRTADYLLTAKYQYITDLSISNPCLHQTFQFHPLYVNLVELSSKTTTTYDLNGENPVVTEQKYFYESPYHFQLTRSENKKSNGQTIVTKTRYPDDFATSTTLYDSSNIPGGGLSNYPAVNKLKSIQSDISSDLNKVSEPIQVETYERVDGTETLLSIQRNNPKIDNTGFVLPDFVEASKKTMALESRVNYHRYDDNGNPIEVSKSDGVHTCYVWGYNSIYPIAKIENATYETGHPNTISSSQITLIENAIAATVNETDESAENILRSELQLLRDGFPQAMVTTYTYDPLIGVTSVTDPKGYTMYYTYDEFNRLNAVKDAEGNLITDYDYQYKTNQ
ncbi:RHS repeat protein [Muricauda sp. NFXS6]|uniref:RHS repeat protein n=1 Tax=Allomuricauda sp. NFXS6 TaxID=2819094 RepID=UPI0032DEEBF5